MIGSQLGTRVRGTVIAAIKHAERRGVVAVLVRVDKSTGTEYVTGLMDIDPDGRPIGDEWNAGRYHRELQRAVVHLAERSGQVA